MKSFLVLFGLVAFALANLQPIEDPIKGRPFFGFPILQTRPGGRITGGEEADPNSIPYQVGLKVNTGDKTAFCGGSLISRDHVLTAAHCCEVAKSIEAICGAHYINDDDEPNRVSIQVPGSNILIHPKWNKLTLSNDICILTLSKPVDLTDSIQPIKIASDNSEKFEGKECTASGWGKDKDSATAISPVLRYVTTSVIKNSVCNNYYFGIIKDTHICADGKGGKSTCNGDSGGPLVVKQNGEPVLVGATSFGISFGCEIGWPPAFTRISSYAFWIKENTGIEF